MGGGWQTYRCERCPLVLEVGGWTSWDEAGVVYAEAVQVACAVCGTLHRVIEDRGACRVMALPAPIRSSRTEVVRDVAGEEVALEVWVTEADWRLVGEFPSGIAARARLACSHCGQVGQLMTHERFLYPDGYRTDAARRQQCPVCQGPMECIAVTDVI